MKTGIDALILHRFIEAQALAQEAKNRRKRKAREYRQNRNKRRGLNALIERLHLNANQ